MRKKLLSAALRMGMIIVGPALLGVAIACMFWTGLGSDPTSVLVDGLHWKTGIAQADASNLVNLLFLLLLLAIDRKKVGIATVTSAFLVGPSIGLAQRLIFNRFAQPDLVLGIVLAVAAVALNGLGLGLYLSAGYGASSFDGLILFLREKTGLSYKNALRVFYAVVFAIGVLLGGVWGIGTVISLALCGPCFQFFYSRMSAWAKRALL